MRILIVEDSKPYAEILGRFFESISPDVSFAFSYHEALDYIPKDPCFDLIVLDVFLGDATDIQSLALVGLAHRKCPQTIVLAISGMADQKRLNETALAAGADAVLHKNELNGQTLLNTCAQAWEQKVSATPDETMKQNLKLHAAACRLILSKLA